MMFLESLSHQQHTDVTYKLLQKKSNVKQCQTFFSALMMLERLLFSTISKTLFIIVLFTFKCISVEIFNSYTGDLASVAFKRSDEEKFFRNHLYHLYHHLYHLYHYNFFSIFQLKITIIVNVRAK